MSAKVLIVEDELEITRLIEQLLQREGFHCQICHDGLAALDVATSYEPDLIILDLMLPTLDGLEVCTRIRQQTATKDPYILMLTARGEEIDRVIGLSTGADDYLTKPFSPRELVARVRALLRRSLRGESSQNIYRTQSFTVDLDQHQALRHFANEPDLVLALTALEFKLLSAFVSHPGRVWSRSQLVENLWGSDFFGDERVVDTQVARLRKKIEPGSTSPRFIRTVTGVGYKFDDQAQSTTHSIAGQAL
ncbi:MAG: response regulator transcription factor [Cyanobacteria bacterium P01_H01_bin.121]